MSSTRHRRRPGDSDEEMDEAQFLQFRRQESSQMSRQSSLKSHNSQRFDLPESQESQHSQKSHISLQSSLPSLRSHMSLRSHQSHGSAVGIPREYDYLFRSSQDDDQVPGLDVNSPVSLSIGVACVVERKASDNNPEIKAHTLPKTFYSYPKNCEEKIKKTIEDRIENDVANFKLQGYHVTTYTFGLPFAVEETCNISRGYDGKTKMLKASRKKQRGDEDQGKDDANQDQQAGPSAPRAKRARK